jgi:hypothetical protein
MGAELAELVNIAWPYVTAAVSGYGTAVLRSSEEAATDATVGWGRQILQRIFGTGEAPEALTDLADDPADTDLQAALRIRIRKALADDPELAEQVRAMLTEASGQGGVTNTVSGSVIHGGSFQIGRVAGDVNVGRG